MSLLILNSTVRDGWDLKFSKILLGYEMEPCTNDCSIVIVKPKKTAFSSIAILSASDSWNSLPSFSNKLILFLMWYNFLSVLLLTLEMTSKCTKQKSQQCIGYSGWTAINISLCKSQTSNDFSFSKNPLMLFKQRYMQAESDSASKIGLNKNNHIVLE